MTDKPATDENHCKDCCCARSWKALGITSYTGKSIAEHIEELKDRTTPDPQVHKIQWFIDNVKYGTQDAYSALNDIDEYLKQWRGG